VERDQQLRRNKLLGLFLGIVGVTIFSGTLPATRVAVQSFDAWFLTFGRAAIAAAAASATIALMRKPFPKQHLGTLLFIGMTLVFGFPGFISLAMVTVPSSHGGVVLGILPLTTTIFAVLFAKERPSALFWLLSIIGATIIFAFTFRDGGFGFETGDFWLLLAGLSASAGYVFSGKLSHHMPGWEVISWALILCAPISIAGTIWLWEPRYIAAPLNHNIAFLYVSLGSMFLGFFAWNTGLKLGGISRVGQLQLLQTFLTLGIAALVLGETVTLETVGYALAVLIVIVASRKAHVKT
jgi:drug/metabolite transporter (DMT)-like permease